MKEEILINSQIVLFFKDPILQPDKTYQGITELIPSLDVTPLIVPVPNDPNLYEVPIVHLQSKNGVYVLDISRKRCDLFIAGEGRQKFSDKKELVLENAEKLFNYFSGDTSISRVAFITRFFIEDNNPHAIVSKLISTNFKDVFGEEVDPSDAYIRYSKKSTILTNIQINNFSTVEKQQANIRQGVKSESLMGIQITRDFNTSHEIDYSDRMNIEILEELMKYGEDNFRLLEIKRILWPTA